MAHANEHLDKLMQELRRGTITIAVLSQLSTPQYGYLLVTTLEDKGIHIEPGTLYPLLRRLEKQGLLESSWDTNEARPRKYYVWSKAGEEVYGLLTAEWDSIVRSMNHVIGKKGDDTNGAN